MPIAARTARTKEIQETLAKYSAEQERIERAIADGPEACREVVRSAPGGYYDFHGRRGTALRRAAVALWAAWNCAYAAAKAK